MNRDENTRKLLALCGMVIIGILVLAIIGEAARYVLPKDALYFFLVSKVYFLTVAIFLLLLGIDKIHMGSVRNMIALFALLLLGIVIAWQLDKAASGILWNGMYPSVYGRIPEKYVTLTLQSMDIVAIAIGALGAFLVLLKGLDKAKDLLISVSKRSEQE